MDTTLDLEQLVRLEATQLREESGNDGGLGAELEALLKGYPERGPARQEALRILYERFSPFIAEQDTNALSEPSDPRQLFAQNPFDHALWDEIENRELTFDRIYGGWLGRIAGCILGKPVEGFSKENIDKLLAGYGETEIEDYLPLPPPNLPQYPAIGAETLLACTRDHIRYAVADDDLNYTILNLHVLEERGRTFTATDILLAWMRYLPADQTFTAERVAYRNFLNGLEPPETGLYMNPYREWIGAQIRADMWGYVNPGNPRKAASMAYRDACVSHRKNGLYGALWAAGCIAAAFAEQEIEPVLRTGMQTIPPGSRLFEALERVIGWYNQSPRNWRSCWEQIMEHYSQYSPVHTITNACFVAMGLLYGQKDFGRTIGIAVHGGFDTDCNGATAGSILGTMLGAKNLPGKWTEVFNDTVQTTLATMSQEKISDLARRTQLTLDNPSLGVQTRM